MTNPAVMWNIGRTRSDARRYRRGVFNPLDRDTSRSSGLPIVFGFTPDGRYVLVVYEQIDEITIDPVTAYDVEE